MSSKLKKIQEYIIKYTETIASILNIDIEIIDNRLYRISGTGIYKDKIDSNIVKESYIYNEVLESNREKVVLNIEENLTCKNCDKYEKCKNKSIIAFPIIYKDVVVGVIGVVSKDNAKKKDISKNLKSYLEFISHISDLISKKIEEYEISIENDKKVEVLRSILDEVDRGVIIIDRYKKISYINNIAMKKLDIKDSLIGQEIDIYFSENIQNQYELLSIKLNNTLYKIKSKTISVIPSIEKYNKIIMFDKIREKKDTQGEINSKWGDTRTVNIIGNSPAMTQVKNKIKKVAKSNSTVMITGESGTGKELIARAIHSEGSRWNKPFIAINCAAIPETLFESELFGYAKGAFSGANNNGKVGKFELANEGVIFLDEIGELPIHLQAKLLRVLQERKFAKIGSNKLIDLDIRIIAATNKDLLQLVKEGKFRDDLYYRLNVISIDLPPLRKRKEDIKDIMMKFITQYSIDLDVNIKNIEDDVIEKFVNYNWPGNIRELENSIEYIMNIVSDDGVISSNMLPLDILRYYKEKGMNMEKKDIDKSLNDMDFEVKDVCSLKEVEMRYINKLLNLYGRDTHSKKEIAKKLGIGLSTLYRKLEEA